MDENFQTEIKFTLDQTTEILKKHEKDLLRTDWKDDDNVEDMLGYLARELELPETVFFNDLRDFFTDAVGLYLCTGKHDGQALDRWRNLSALYIYSLLEIDRNINDVVSSQEELEELEETTFDEHEEFKILKPLAVFKKYKKCAEEAAAILEETIDFNNIGLDDLRRGIELVKIEKEEKRKTDMAEFQLSCLKQNKGK